MKRGGGEKLAEKSIEKNEVRGSRAWVGAILAWLVPGAGHIWQGRLTRGLILGSVIWIMFFAGALLGGHLYSILDASSAGMLSYVFGFCNLGAGLLYVLARSAEIAVKEQANLSTAEYGNVFLMVAGLLNYLLALDAFDIGIRRKS